MTWLRIDDGFEDHAKVEPLSNNALRLWLRAACWCCKPQNEHTQGFVPRKMLRTIAKKMASQKRLEELALELVNATGGGIFKVGLWEPVEGGWRFHDWHVYRRPEDPQPKPQTLSRSEAARAAGLRSAEVRRARNGTAQPPNDSRTTLECRFEQRASNVPERRSNNEPRTFPNVVRTPDPDPDPEIPDPEVGINPKDLSGVTRAGTSAPPPQFLMKVGWEPSETTRKSLEVAGVPQWAHGVLLARFALHFSETDLLGSQTEWQQRFTRWALGDWHNPEKRPKAPRPELAKSSANDDDDDGNWVSQARRCPQSFGYDSLEDLEADLARQNSANPLPR